jgi:hypothetical protein
MPSDYKIPTVAVHPLDGIPPHWNEAELKSAVGEFIAGPQGNNGLGGHLDQGDAGSARGVAGSGE